MSLDRYFDSYTLRPEIVSCTNQDYLADSKTCNKYVDEVFYGKGFLGKIRKYFSEKQKHNNS